MHIMMPPMIIQMPPTGPQMPTLPGYESWSTSAQPATRSWTTIGGDGDAH